MITSIRNAKVAAAVRLKKRALRDREGAFLVEGAKAVGEAIASGAHLSVLFHAGQHPLLEPARAAGVEVTHVSEDVMQRLTSTITPQGLVAVASSLDATLGTVPDPLGCVAVLHSVRDPGNAGTVLRSADAAGADAVVFSSTSVDVYNPKTVRASAGSLFHVPVVRGVETPEAIAALRERGCAVLVMDARGDADLYEVDLTVPTAFVFGNEAWGLPREIVSLADVVVRVPISGRAESLNLAAAATVCLFEWARQRREDPRVALGTVIASAAHDIRSPLTAMKGFGYALAAHWERMTEDQRSIMLQGIVYDTDRLNMIVRQLVDAARIAAGGLDLYPERVDVASVVVRVADARGRDPEHPPVHWEGDGVEVFVDPDRLQMVLEAFVEAAVWWGSEGPIRVRGAVRSDRLRVDVEREGADLSPEEAEALFRPRPPGTGAGSKIGLYVARGIAAAQGGTATASMTDRRLRFTLEVPAETPLPGSAGALR